MLLIRSDIDRRFVNQIKAATCIGGELLVIGESERQTEILRQMFEVNAPKFFHLNQEFFQW